MTTKWWFGYAWPPEHKAEFCVSYFYYLLNTELITKDFFKWRISV